jgi:hypothetical protein
LPNNKLPHAEIKDAIQTPVETEQPTSSPDPLMNQGWSPRNKNILQQLYKGFSIHFILFLSNFSSNNIVFVMAAHAHTLFCCH